MSQSVKEMEQERENVYQRIFEANPDFIGWLSIEDTALDYPVMHTPKQEQFYLRRSFEKEYSVYGTPFMAAACDRDLTCDNMLIYGHYVKDGSLFGSLLSYKDQAYYEAHPIISFDTADGKKEYQILAAFKTQLAEDAFAYYEFIDGKDEKAYENYIQTVKALAFYDTGVEASFGDQLLTLSTCEGSLENGRFVVVAKEKGEQL